MLDRLNMNISSFRTFFVCPRTTCGEAIGCLAEKTGWRGGHHHVAGCKVLSRAPAAHINMGAYPFGMCYTYLVHGQTVASANLLQHFHLLSRAGWNFPVHGDLKGINCSICAAVMCEKESCSQRVAALPCSCVHSAQSSSNLNVNTFIEQRRHSEPI